MSSLSQAVAIENALPLQTYMKSNMNWHVATPFVESSEHGFPCGVWSPARPEYKHHYSWDELLQHGCVPKNLILIGVQNGEQH